MYITYCQKAYWSFFFNYIAQFKKTSFQIAQVFLNLCHLTGLDQCFATQHQCNQICSLYMLFVEVCTDGFPIHTGSIFVTVQLCRDPGWGRQEVLLTVTSASYTDCYLKPAQKRSTDPLRRAQNTHTFTI